MTETAKKEKRKHSWLDNWFTFHVAPYGIAGICLALFKTWKIAFRGEEHIRRLRDEGKRPIYAFWHERLFALAPAYRRENCIYLSSESRDGEISARANEFIGFTVVRGSASHSGLKALRSLIKRSDAGFDVGITPDGPRGPRRVLKDGAVYLGMKTGLPIVPVTAASTNKWILKSWDRFQIPKPFARVLISLGEPIYLPPKMSREMREEAKHAIEQKMIKHIEEADRLVKQLPRGILSRSRSRPRPWITGRAEGLNDGS